MIQPASPQPGPEGTPQSLRELHRLYLKFMTQCVQERGRDYPWRDYGAFVAWWQQLDPVVREICERDFRKGYEAVVAEGERQVAAALAKYELPEGQAG